ncbi:MAG: hypothetical protein ACK5Y2_05480 [Bdellovibrionales bacterium]
MKTVKWLGGAALAALVATAYVGCGGGGGGGSVTVGGGGAVIRYPYETVFGSVCSTFEPTPGCTFSTSTGRRITVSADPHYDRYGYGSDDLWFVTFDSQGRAAVYNDLGRLQYYADIRDFAGWVGGNIIGVGTSGLFWENVAGGTYWLGKNGVLYSANWGDSNYGEAINNKNAGKASDASAAALASDSNKRLVARAADKMVKEYGLSRAKATAVASALNTWAVNASTRGYTTTKDIDSTFKGIFGVRYSEALSAVKALQTGDTSGMRDVTDRSASALGLKPHQAQKFIKGMYKKALASYGLDADMINW